MHIQIIKNSKVTQKGTYKKGILIQNPDINLTDKLEDN